MTLGAEKRATRIWEKTCPACGESFAVGGACGPMRKKKYCCVRCAGFSPSFSSPRGAMPLEMKKEDAAWLAGLFDGEGCVIIYKSSSKYSVRYAMKITLSNTNSEALVRCRDISGVGNVVLGRAGTYKSKPSYYWVAGSETAAAILRQILQYSFIKKPQVELALKFQEKMLTASLRAQLGWQLEMKNELHLLNYRGPRIITQRLGRPKTEAV